MAKVIHVHLTHGIEGTKRKDWYFSSISAVYTVFTAEQVGAYSGGYPFSISGDIRSVPS